MMQQINIHTAIIISATMLMTTISGYCGCIFVAVDEENALDIVVGVSETYTVQLSVSDIVGITVGNNVGFMEGLLIGNVVGGIVGDINGNVSV